jgi:hypothetical protein
LELNVTATVDISVAHADEVGVVVGFVVVVLVVGVGDGFEAPEPDIAMSAQVKYICGV